MKNYKHLSFEGKVGRDAEMRNTPAGKAVTSFSVAVNDDYWNKQSNELVKQVAWFQISAWGKLAEICNDYVKKGMSVIVEGWFTPDPATGSPRTWTNKAGEVQSSYEVTAQTVRFLSTRQEDQAELSHDPVDIGDGPPF